MGFAVFRQDVAVERREPGAFVDGVWAPGVVSPSVTFIKASVQPASQDDLERLPEGQRITGAYKLFTNDTLRLARDGQEADRVQIGGDWYLVTAAEDWNNGIVPHNVYIVTRIVEGAE